jgi:Leucine-rich repeat (LRR) protein
MPWNVFGKMNDYPDLEVIDMTNNNIKEIKGKTYHHVRNVKTLILNHNQLNITGDKTHPRIFSNFVNLESLHLTNAFSESVDSKEYLVALEQIFVGSNLTKLSKVHLEQNEIWSIKNPNIFCSLPSLMDIQLGDNNISEMNFNVGCIQNLRFIDLRNNKIHNLSNNTLSKFEELPEQGLGVKLDLMVT